jgi:AraC-like DNA-binding protein
MTSVLEKTLLDFEKNTGFQVTLIDCSGYFIDAEGVPLFPQSRHSHKLKRGCSKGFKDLPCISHCRHEMMNRAIKEKQQAFVHTCWRDINEMVFPLMVQDQLCGLLYIGQWSTHPSSELEIVDHKALNVKLSWLALFADGLMNSILQLKTKKHSPAAEIIYLWIDQHCDHQPRLTQLAKHLKVSPSRCSHIVKETLGISFQAAVALEKSFRARAMLSNTNLSITQIAKCLGFSDTYHFSHFVKKAVGQSPRQYRKSLGVL